MRSTIEIAAAALLVFCIAATSAAFAAGKPGRSADGLSCSFRAPAKASPAARCAAIKRQCGGKFYANYCGDRLLSAMCDIAAIAGLCRDGKSRSRNKLRTI